MSNQIVISSGAKVRNLGGVLTATAGVVSSVGYGTANGVATLDSTGKVPLSQLPASVVTYLGTWNASTNTPTLTNGVGDVGDLYICNVAGTVNFGAGPITFAVGDWVIYSGTTWQKSAGSSGTVTSVAMTVPTGLSVTGSPITTSGTLALSLSSGYTIPTTSFLAGLVPYIGATSNVDLGEYELKAGQLTLDVSPTGTATVGTTRWNNTIGSSETTLKGGSVILKNGVDLVIRVVNKVTPNTTLTKASYPAVRVSGAQGQRLAVAYAQANNDNNSADTIGLVIETIATNQEGFIMTVGQLSGVNTTGSLQGETWADGDVLYLSPTTPGALTNIKPNGLTGHIVIMGYVEYAHSSNGSIYVKIMNGWELDELHNVYITIPTNNQGLFYNSSNSLWENKSIATALGYTPANDSLVVHLAGNETITGIKTFSAATEFTSSQSVAFNYGLGIAKGNTPSIFSSSAVYLYSSSGNNNLIIKDNTNTSKLQFQAASSYTYTFPASTGTIALTSDIPSLTGYVPYTGATSSVNLGIYGFTAASIYVAASGSNAGQIQLKQGNTFTTPNGYGTFGSGDVNNFYFYQNSSSVVRGAILSLAYITGGATRTYNLPDADGTLALTSQIPSLSGYVQGSGTTNYLPKFTGTSTIGNSMLTDDGTTLQSIGATRSNLYLKAASNSYYSQLAFTNGTNGSFGGISYNNSGQYMQFETNSSEWARLNSNGNFLIGTTSDNGSKLQVSGAATFSSSVTTTQLIQAADSSAEMKIGRYNSSFPNAYIDAIGPSGDVGFQFRTQIAGAGGGTKMTITASGNVGIGTSSPNLGGGAAGSTILTISATSSGRNGLIELNGTRVNATDITGYLRFYNNSAATPLADIRALRGSSDTTGDLAFTTSDTERMRITSGGNVGIGVTPSSDNRLQIYGSDSSSSNYAVTVQNSSGTVLFRLRNDGVFVTGTASLSPYNLTIGAGANLYVNSLGELYRSTSSLKYKKDIRNYDKGLNEVLKLRPVYYKGLKDEHTQFAGLIAEEVNDLGLSEFVEYAEDKTPDAIHYPNMIALLTKAIQELSAKVTALENK